MKKKLFKILGITVLIILIILIALPFIFESKIESIVRNYVDKNVHAKVEFSHIGLSLISSFPNAELEIDDLDITNYEPFKDEKLLTAKSIALVMPIKELFKLSGGDPLTINSITIDEALLSLKTNKNGTTNYDIMKASEDSGSGETESTGSSFTFDIQDYRLETCAINYIDEASGIALNLSELDHNGKGTFSAEKSELDTHTATLASITIDSTKYLNNTLIKLDALIGLDLDNQVYTFKENKGYLNQLPLEFDGFVKLLENGQEVDITFENPGSTFKDFLALVPETYSKDLDNVETTGDFKVKGIIKGMVTEETIPTIDIKIASNNASFKYPDLPKRVENIVIDTDIKNTTGNSEDTYVAINTLNFKIDEDAFKASAQLRNLASNMMVNANLDGTINLANISKVYPVDLQKEMSGILRAKLNTQFDMNALETNAYQRIRTSGNLVADNLIFSSEDLPNPMHISTANVTFNPETVTLNSFKAQTGTTDLNATGTLKNLIGFLLSSAKLQGTLNLASNHFALSDLMTSESTQEETHSESTEALNIPDFLDCTINAKAATVKYDDLDLKNVQGTLIVKDQKATLQNFDSNLFDGKLGINGSVSSKKEVPEFDLKLNMDDFDIAQSFKGLDLFQALVPVAKVLQGKLNTDISLSGKLNNNLTPQLNSLTGKALAEILTSSINASDSKALTALQQNFNFIDFNKLDLKDLKANLDFSDGKVNVKPYHVKYKDIDMEISGSHGLDQLIDYNVVFQVPAKYLGSEVNQLIGKINDPSVTNLTIPVTANLTGNLNSPKVTTDLSNSVQTLTARLIEIEKQKLLNQGGNAIKDLLGDITGTTPSSQTQTSTDSTSATTSSTPPKTEEVVKDVLGNLLSGKKKKKDSTN